MDNQEIITIEEMCEILNIGKNTAYKLLKNKDIAAFRIGRHWKISKTAVNDSNFILALRRFFLRAFSLQIWCKRHPNWCKIGVQTLISSVLKFSHPPQALILRQKISPSAPSRRSLLKRGG